MVRTAADGGRKAVAAKAPRKAIMAQSVASSSGACASPAGNKYAGGNAVCPRPVPEWQKGIKGFLLSSPPEKKETDEETDKENTDNENAEPVAEPMDTAEESGAGSSSSKPEVAKNGLISDDDDE